MQCSAEMIARNSSYRAQESTLTLEQGLNEYYATNRTTVTRPADLARESATLFLCHDICHVIFGLTTDLQDEAVVDFRTVLSSNVGLVRYFGYLSHDREVKSVFERYGYLRSLWTTIQAFPRIVVATREAWRMKKRWPWVPPESYLNRTLADLRQEFGIRVV